jgi:hypothetical protein
MGLSDCEKTAAMAFPNTTAPISVVTEIRIYSHRTAKEQLKGTGRNAENGGQMGMYKPLKG